MQGKWLDVVFLVWMDSSSLDNPNIWREAKLAETLSPAIVGACGFVIQETPDHITIASHAGLEQGPGKRWDEVAGELCIPKVSIVQRKDWKVFQKAIRSPSDG